MVIEVNFKVLCYVVDVLGVKVFVVFKVFLMFVIVFLVSKYFDGICVFGIYEVCLGYEEYGGEVVIFCVGYKDSDIDEIIVLLDYMIFNLFV